MAVNARFQADFEAFFSAVQKADVKLNDFEKGVGKVNTTLQRLTSSYDGTQIIKEATMTAAAIEKIGGASKLTEAEQARVNATITAALAKYKALGIEAPDALVRIAGETKKVEAATTPASKSMQGFLDHFKGTLAGMVSAAAIIGAVRGAFQALTAFVSSSVKSYADAEAAQKKLTTALESAERATPAVIGQFSNLAKQFQNTTVYGDDLITEMQALLVEVGSVMPNQMEGALKAATNLASGLGIDLRQATLLVGKAFAGETGTLKRYGIVIDEAKLKAEGMPAVLDAIQQRFGGQAAAEAETYAGKVKQLANAWDDFQEAVGRSVVDDPLLKAGLKSLTDGLRGSSDAAAEATGTITGFVVNLVSGSKEIQTAIDIYAGLQRAFDNVDASVRKLSNIKAPESLTFALPQITQAEIDQIYKGSDAQTKAIDASKRYGEAVRALRDQLSGAKLQSEVQKLHDAFRALSPEQLRSAETFDRVGLAARRLHDDGAVLTPELFRILVASQRLTPEVQNLGSEFLNTLGPGLKMAYDLGVKLPTVIHGISGAVSAGNVIAMEIPQHLVKGWKESEELAKANEKAVGDLARSLGTLAQVSGGAFGQIVHDIGTFVDAMRTARDSTKELNDGLTALKSGETSAGIMGTATALLGLVSAAYATGKALQPLLGLNRGKLGALLGTNNQGRNDVEDFAASYGGFDALHVKLLTLGDAGERMWIRLTQLPKNSDVKAARAAIDEITSAFDTQATAAEQAAAKTAAAQDAVTAKLQESIGKITSEIDSLTGSIADEAPEKVMGHFERRARARIAQLEDERLEVQAQMDEAAREAEEAAKNAGGGVTDLGDKLTGQGRIWREWADTAVSEAERVQRAVDAISFGHSPGGLKEIPLKFAEALRASAAFAGRFSADMTRAADVADLGLRSGRGGIASAASDHPIVIHNYTMLDGDVLARNMAQRLPKVIRTFV